MPPIKNGLRDFSRLVLINLPRRADRLAAFQQRARQTAFPAVEIFPAIDGSKVPAPDAWKSGGGAWGCMESHRQILQSCLIRGQHSVLVLEDDCLWRDTWADELENFLAGVPDDWECLMLGGQHMIDPPQVRPGVVRCRNAQRTHAYALRGPIIYDLLKLWTNTNHHCDWEMGPFMAQRKCYAPQPFIFGQNQGPSDINGKNNPTLFWNSGDKPPVVWLKNTSPERVHQLRTLGFHTGYSRDAAGVDVGLNEIFAPGVPPILQVRKLRPWIDLVSAEARSISGGKCAVWHPAATEQVLKKVMGDDLIILENPTVEEALKAFMPHPPQVFWHVAAMGNWREVCREQLALAERSGFREMTVGFLGSPAERAELEAMAPAPVRLNVAFSGEDLKRYEWPTLRLLAAWCRDHEGPVLYWHTKGVSNPDDARKRLWRELMERELVAKWRERVGSLQAFDVVGVDWMDGGLPHFSGNFWISTARHIRSLVEIDAYQQSPRHRMEESNQARCGAEFWIGSAPCRPLSLVYRNQNLWNTDCLANSERRCPRCQAPWDGHKCHRCQYCGGCGAH